MAIELRWGSVSIVGNVRENNEDRFFVDPQGRFFLVADGMGGQCAGEKASAMAAELVPRKLESILPAGDDAGKVTAGIDAAVAHANGEIMALSELDPEYHNMGTTLALAVRAGNRLFIAGVGDSPVYQLRGRKLEKLTVDHSLTQALLDAGTITAAEAVKHRYRNVLYRYLGTKEGGIGTKPRAVELKSGDRYILCSDGATDGLSDEQLAELLGAAPTPQAAAQTIVYSALAGGSRDNITCVTVFVEG